MWLSTAPVFGEALDAIEFTNPESSQEARALIFASVMANLETAGAGVPNVAPCLRYARNMKGVATRLAKRDLLQRSLHIVDKTHAPKGTTILGNGQTTRLVPFAGSCPFCETGAA